VAEAMMACVLLDHLLLDRGQTGGLRGVIAPDHQRLGNRP
jgi:chorismate synthase